MYVPVSSYVIVHWFLKIRDWLVLCTSWSCISVHNIGQRCRSTLITLTWPAHLAPCAGPGHTWSTFIHTNTIRKTPVQIVHHKTMYRKCFTFFQTDVVHGDVSRYTQNTIPSELNTSVSVVIQTRTGFFKSQPLVQGGSLVFWSPGWRGGWRRRLHQHNL